MNDRRDWNHRDTAPAPMRPDRCNICGKTIPAMLYDPASAKGPCKGHDRVLRNSVYQTGGEQG